MGKSKERTDFFGDKYTEHTNDQGEKIGESRERTDFFGDKYTEHTNKKGDKTGESSGKTSFFGDKYVEHTDKHGKKIGESRKRKGLFGDEYIENDSAGRGESVKVENNKVHSSTQTYNEIKETSVGGWLISYALAGFVLSILILIFSDMGFGESFGFGFLLPLFWKMIKRIK